MDQGNIADIVVTAERRSSSVQKTPIAISAIGGDALRASAITNIEALSGSVPGLSFARNAGDAKVFIRGVGYDSVAPGGETRVALYQDGIYQSRTQSALLGFYDVDRIEVLRGPQGTLYGRNAIAGTINILTRDPGSTPGGFVTGTVGNYGAIATEGAIGGPLTDDLQGRFAFRTSDRDGWGRNIGTGERVGDEQIRSARAKLKYTPASSVTVRLEADYTSERDRSGGYRFIAPAGPGIPVVGLVLGGVVPRDRQDSAGFGPRNCIEAYGASGQVDWAVSDRTTLTSLTGYRNLTQELVTNIDGTTLETNRQYITERSNTVSQEFRLGQQLGTVADLIAGAYYFHETNSALNEVPFAAFVFGLPGDALYEGYATSGLVKTDAYAAFGQANIHLTGKLQLDLGLRYSDERKSIAEVAQFDFARPFVLGDALIPLGSDRQKLRAHSLDPKATLSYRFTPDVFAYATYSRGFKSGGFNVGGLQPPFQPEKLTNYEVGLKASLFDRRLRANLAGFVYDYKQLQVNIVEGFALVTKNAASARVKGLEAEITALPVDDLRLSLNASYLDATYRDFSDTDLVLAPAAPQDLSGNRLNNAPEYSLDGTIAYTARTNAGNFTPRANAKFIDRVFFNQFNTLALSQPKRFELNLFLDWELPSAGLSATLFLRNATDKTYVVGATNSTPLLGSPVVGQYGPPRAFGAIVTKRF